MRKLVIIGIVLIVLVGAVALLLVNLDGIVNKNKDFLLDRAEATLGRKVSVGEIGVTLRGGIGVNLKDVSLADDPSFANEPFVEASDLQVNAKILPLLRKQFRVKRVILRNPVIRLIRNEDGNLNILSLTQFERGDEPSEVSETGRRIGGAAPLLISLASIDNGEVHFVDKKDSLELRVTKIESSVKDLDLEKPISLELEAALVSDERNVKLSGTFGPVGSDPSSQPDFPIQAEVDLTPIDLTKLFESFPRLKQGLPPDLSMEGSATVRVRADGRLSDMTVSLDLDGTQIHVRGPQGFEKAAGIALTFSGDTRYSKERLTLNGAELRFGPLETQLDGDILFGPPPALDIDVKSKNVNLAGWESIVPMVAEYGLSGSADIAAKIEGSVGAGRTPSITGTAKISNAQATLPQYPKPLTEIGSDIAFSEKRAEARDLSLRIGGSTVEGSATIENFTRPVIDYAVRSSSLALADLRPPQPNIKKPEILKNVTAQGRLIAGDDPTGGGTIASPAGSIANFDYEDLNATFSIAGKKILIDDMKARTMGGELAGKGQITTGDESTTFDFQAKANGVDITELFSALPGSVQQSLRGTASLDLRISGAGREWGEMKKTLNGDGLAEVLQGEIIDWNIGRSLFAEIDRFAGSSLISQQVRNKYPKVFDRQHTEFKNLASDFVIQDGKLLARNLQLNHDDYRIKGRGSLDFDRGLEFVATFVVSNQLSADLINQYSAAKHLKNQQGQIEVPIVLSGTLPGVKVRPDSDYLRSVMSKALVDEGLDLLKKKNLKDIFPFGKKSESKADSTQKR
ncbi:MAG: AsmA family protein [Candidatus Latescibacterota bacterium]|nr:MAG: AsmA family protein [Candidatus Latescibacterota bacterium]